MHEARADDRPTGAGAARRRPMRRATLKTVAELTGLHVSTVSRVLNGTSTNARSASAATAERIRQAACEVGYVPDASAAGLRMQRSQLVGVVMARLADQVLATIYEGIEHAALRHGLQTMVTNSWDDADARKASVDMLLARRVDAVIFGDAHVDGAFVAEFATRGVPFVLVNRYAEGYPSVTCDDYAGGRLAAEHLISLGHVHAGVLAGLPYASNGVDRTRGFRDTFTEHGLPEPEAVATGFDAASGALGAERLLQSTPRPTAMFAVSDFAAIGAMGVLRQHSLVPGHHVAVVGFNDVPIAAQLTIPLTSVHSPMHEVGSRGVDMLMEVLDGHRPDSIRLQPELRVRESSSGPAGGVTGTG
ncbi:LacI family DNA-binding transcriptional regulator [Phytoactinopolyspora limicola]|uniref:LacI family DNA-binding transcriptional regulator n=1 Tax=Phytoactinopolyspora limicola TaxID=2715536 RepID=UPI001A9C4347|nr:LacI family DNA-binding transcriptional regulator [Phytoactinopolyspora limicola]